MDLRAELTSPALDDRLEDLGLDRIDRRAVVAWAAELDDSDRARLDVLVSRLDEAFDARVAGRAVTVFEDSDTHHRLGPGVLVVLALALAAPGLAARSSYPAEVVTATQADLAQQLRCYRAIHDETGLDVAWWMETVFADGFARLGRLQFELTTSGLGVGTDADDVVPVLSVHVPAQGRLDEEAVDDALGKATAFFEEHHPDKAPIEWFVCHSWLLDPAMTFLMPTSNIASFTRRWDVWKAVDDDRSVLQFAFDVALPEGVDGPGGLDRLPTDTALRRALVEYWRDGEHMMSCSGRLWANRPDAEDASPTVEA